MEATLDRAPRRSLIATALVRGPLVALFACPLAILAGIPLAPAITGIHATERREPPRRMLVLAALSTIAALALFLAFWVAFFGLMGDMSGFD